MHPDGQFGLHHKRKVRLTEQQYFAQRILNQDPRFSKSPSYIFAAAAYIEQKQLSNKANISYMRGKKSRTARIQDCPFCGWVVLILLYLLAYYL